MAQGARARGAQMQSKAKRSCAKARRDGERKGGRRVGTTCHGHAQSYSTVVLLAVNTTVHGRHAVPCHAMPCRGMAGDGKLKRCEKGGKRCCGGGKKRWIRWASRRLIRRKWHCQRAAARGARTGAWTVQRWKRRVEVNEWIMDGN